MAKSLKIQAKGLAFHTNTLGGFPLCILTFQSHTSVVLHRGSSCPQRVISNIRKKLVAFSIPPLKHRLCISTCAKHQAFDATEATDVELTKTEEDEMELRHKAQGHVSVCSLPKFG